MTTTTTPNCATIDWDAYEADVLRRIRNRRDLARARARRHAATPCTKCDGVLLSCCDHCESGHDTTGRCMAFDCDCGVAK